MKVSKLLASILLIATTAIFTNCSNKTATSGTSQNSTTSDSTSGMNYTGKIAFVRMDTLMKAYGLYIDLSDEFSKKGQKIEAELTQKGRALEREVNAYQEKAQKGLITRYESQSTEEGLQKKNQSLVAYRDKMMAEMQQDEIVMLNKISETILSYLNEYNKTKGYSMILQTTGSTPILVADPSLDITQEVLEELNKRYLESRGTAKKLEDTQESAEAKK